MRRSLIRSVLVGSVLVGALTGCGSTPSGAAAETPSAEQIKSVEDFVQAEANHLDQQGNKVTSATIAVAPGTVDQSNTGYRCTSGTLLKIVLNGNFPGIAVSPMVGATDTTVRAVLITADGHSGRKCLEGVSTAVQNPSGTTPLPLS